LFSSDIDFLLFQGPIDASILEETMSFCHEAGVTDCASFLNGTLSRFWDIEAQRYKTAASIGNSGKYSRGLAEFKLDIDTRIISFRISLNKPSVRF
jgi:hypothetical protein